VTDPVIAIHDLVKTFGATRALDGLDLSVAAGEVHGFLGPNGAGKSTTIRALLGLLRTDSGSLSVFGLDPWADSVAIHRRLAYVPGDVALWPNLSGGETVDMLLRMRGVEPRGTRREEMLERFDLDPTKRGRAYSKGNRQKVALVAALAADVELLLMDEPTSGLDPLMEAVFQQVVHEAAADGRTVLLSSHILAEVEALCRRVTIIRQGRAVQSGSLEELRSLTRTTVTVGLRDADEAERALAEVGSVQHVQRADGHLTVDVDTASLNDVLARLTTFGVQSLTAHPPTLEDLFLREYSDELATLGVVEGSR
jgi:ABC-2 type transport system ATP-binding protein